MADWEKMLGAGYKQVMVGILVFLVGIIGMLVVDETKLGTVFIFLVVAMFGLLIVMLGTKLDRESGSKLPEGMDENFDVAQALTDMRDQITEFMDKAGGEKKED